MADNKHDRHEKKEDKPSAVPPPIPAPKHEPKPAANVVEAVGKSTFWKWLIGLTAAKLLLPEDKVPGAIGAFFRMFWEMLGFVGRVTTDKVAEAGAWVKKYGRKAALHTLAVVLVAVTIGCLGIDLHQGWLVAIAGILLWKTAVLWWVAINALVSLVAEALKAGRDGMSLAARFLTGLFRLDKITVPKEEDPWEMHESFYLAIKRQIKRIFVVIPLIGIFTCMLMLSPYWSSFLALFMIFAAGMTVMSLTALLEKQIKRGWEIVLFCTWTLLIVLVAGFFLRQFASETYGLMGLGQVDHAVAEWLQRPTVGALGIILFFLAVPVAVGFFALGHLRGSVKRQRFAYLTWVAGVFSASMIAFLFWNGTLTKRELKGSEPDQTETASVEKKQEASVEKPEVAHPAAEQVPTDVIAPPANGVPNDLPPPAYVENPHRNSNNGDPAPPVASTKPETAVVTKAPTARNARPLPPLKATRFSSRSEAIRALKGN